MNEQCLLDVQMKQLQYGLECELTYEDRGKTKTTGKINIVDKHFKQLLVEGHIGLRASDEGADSQGLGDDEVEGEEDNESESEESRNINNVIILRIIYTFSPHQHLPHN